MIKYNAKEASNLLPDGKYDAVIVKCYDKISKNDNLMYELTYEVYTKTGDKRRIFDRIVFPKMTWKLKKLARAIDKLEEFENETFDPRQHIGAAFIATVETEEDSTYGDKNIVTKYEKIDNVSEQVTQAAKRAMERMNAASAVDDTPVSEDDIPF